MADSWRKKVEKAIKLFEGEMYPSFSCIVCGRETDNVDIGLCDECYLRLKLHNGNTCKFCGDRISDGDLVCAECKHVRYEFDKAYSFCDYDELSGKVIKDLKYNGKLYISAKIAQILAILYESSGETADFITFVPASKATLLERGYNQTELIANELSRLIGVPVLSFVYRAREVERQATLSGDERKNNLKDVFKADGSFDIKNKTVAIIDDVFSTGTTLSEMAKAIKRLKPKRVFAMTFAKTHTEII
ncbi:MAG: ComF family protein [Clostridia bacterium]|nr:ComF family protein [Clostridia bacterium]